MDTADSSDCVLFNGRVTWLDPVSELDKSLSNFRFSADRYYARSRPLPMADLDSQASSIQLDAREQQEVNDCRKGKKKKRKKMRETKLNEMEMKAVERHLEIENEIMVAQSAFASYVESCGDLSARLGIVGDLMRAKVNLEELEEEEILRSMGSTWQADLCELEMPGIPDDDSSSKTTFPLFNTLVTNSLEKEILASALNHLFVIPPSSSFLMSDIDRMEPLLPRSAGEGYNLIVIDPPWENKSVQRGAGYPTLPNRRLLGLPIRQLSHSDGALVALWVTNREKLRHFVESELFPKWGVRQAASWIWLKVGPRGNMISPLGNPHHRPYEILLLGYLFPASDSRGSGSTILKADVSLDTMLSTFGVNKPPDKHVVISVPGEHSRKPPLGRLLFPHVPSSASSPPPPPASSSSSCSPPHRVRPLELFARNLLPGWTSWGNEPLRFQYAAYFTARSDR